MALIQNPKANADWKKRSEEERRMLIQLASEGRTMSGRTFAETTALPKNAKYSYDDFLSQKSKVLASGKTEIGSLATDVSKARKTGYYARQYIKQNADQFDAKNGAGTSQQMLDNLDRELKDLDDYQGRVGQKNQQAQIEAAQKTYQKNVRMGIYKNDESAKSKADSDKAAQQAMEIIQQQNANGGSASNNGHGGSKSWYFGGPTVQPKDTTPIQETKPTLQSPEDAAAYYGISPELKKKLDAEALAKSQNGSYQPVIRADQSQKAGSKTVQSAGISDQSAGISDQLRKQQQSVAAKMKGDSLSALRTAKQNQSLTLDQIGQYGQGNVDLYNRPVVYNDDGSYSSLYSVSFEDDDGKEVLVPSIVVDKNGNPKKLTEEEAWDHYKQTGEYLGKFNTPDEADAYAEKIHTASDNSYGAEIEKNHPVQVNYAPKQNNPTNAAPTAAEAQNDFSSDSEAAAARYGISPELKKKLDAEAFAKSQSGTNQPVFRPALTVTQSSVKPNEVSEDTKANNLFQAAGDAVGQAASSVWDFIKNSASEMGKATFDMTVGTVFHTTWDQMQEEDKASHKTGVGIIETVKDGLLSAGGQFNNSVLGAYASAVDLTQSALKNLFGLKTSRNYARDLQTANMENLTKAIKPMIENGTWLENIAMNTIATSTNSFALMIPGMALAGKVGSVMGGGIGTVNTARRVNQIELAGNIAQMTPFAIQDATDGYDQAKANGANDYQAAANGLFSGLMGLATNSKAYEDYGEKLGLGVASNPKMLAGVSSAYMGANWGESAVTWFKDALTTMGMAEGLQEVSESLAIKLNDDMWNRSIFDTNKWQNWAQNVKQDFMYGYLSGALFYVTALPAYAPSRQMLTGMIAGDTETTPEQIGTFIAQVAEDTQDENLKPNAEAALEDVNKAEAIAGKVTEGEPLQQARQEATAEQIASAQEKKASAAEDQDRVLLQEAQDAVQQKYAEPEQDAETGTQIEAQNSPAETDEVLPVQAQARKTAEAAGQSVAQPLAVQSEERTATAETNRVQSDEQTGSAMDAEAQVQNETGAANVTVKNIRAVENGTVYFNVEDEDGETGVARADDVRFADDQTNDLLAVVRAKNMTIKAVDQYLKNYDSGIAAPEEYAQAYEGVFNRARIGMSYAEAATNSLPAQKYLTEDARIAAYAAGHTNTVAVRKGTSAPEKTGGYGLVRAYTQEAYAKIGDANARRQAGMELNALQALAEKYKVKMRVTESIDMTDANGKVTKKSGANGKYDPKTGEITIALDAMDHAYLYVGIHELTHMLKAENADLWDDFELFIADALDRNGQDMNELVSAQMKRGNMNADEAAEEVIANTAPALLMDEENLNDLLSTNRTLFETVADWIKEFVANLREIGNRLTARAGWAQMNNLKDDAETLRSMWAKMKSMLEEHRETAGAVKNQAVTGSEEKAKHDEKSIQEEYDYTRPFADQVDDWVAGKIPKNDTLVLGPTPMVFQKIGLSALPMTMDQEHIDYALNGTKNEDHHMSLEMLKKLPELLNDPVAIISSETRPDDSVVAIVKGKVNGKQQMAAVNFGSNGRINGMTIDSNYLTSTQGRSNTISKLLEDAVQKEHAGMTGVYYWKKSEARALFVEYGVQFSGIAMQDGLIHSIYEEGSPVKKYFTDYMQQTDTQQFKRWFGKSKVTDATGEPLVVYHGASNKFYQFDADRTNYGETSRGFNFFTNKKSAYQNSAADYALKYKNGQVMEVYLKIEKPLWLKSNGYDTPVNYYDANYADIQTRYLQGNYDGIIIENANKAVDDSVLYMVENSNQVKSATDNIGLFDRKSQDIRYSENETPETVSGSDVEVMTLNREHGEAERAGETMQDAFEATAGHRISAAEADRLAAYVLKESNSQYDRGELARRIAEVYALGEGGADAGTVQAAQYDLMKDVLAGSRTLMTEHEEHAKPIREMLRNTPVKLTDAQWAEAANQMDSVGAYRRALFGKVRITRSAPQTLDQAWEEWSVTAPEYFPPNTSETDMPRLMVEAVDALKPVYQNEYGFNVEEGAQYLAMQMNDAYLKLPGVKAAAKEQKRLGLADEQYRQAMAAYRDQSKEQFDAALATIRGAQQKQKQTEQQQRTAAMKKKYATWRAADMESRRATELREKIRTVGLDLSTRLTQPKGEKYIPEALLGSVAKTCDAVVNAMQTVKGADTQIGERISGLITQLDAMKRVQDADYASEDYEGLNGMAQSLVDEIGDKSIREMSYGQLAKVYNLLKGIQTTVQNAKKLIGRKEAITTYQAGTQTIRELNAARGFKDTPLGRFQDLYVESMLGGLRFFRRATGYAHDSTLVKLAEELNDGERNSIEIKRKGKALFYEFTDTKEKLKWLRSMQGKDAKWSDVGFKDEDGNPVPVTRAMVISLYLHSQNAENLKHILNGGLVIPEQQAYRRGDLKQAYANGTKVAGLTKEAVASATDTMSTEESALANAAYGFFNNFTKKYINDTSTVMNGYRKATVDNYFPIRTDSNYLVSNFDLNAGEMTAASLMNPGWLVERKQASQPIYLEDVVNVIERQLDGVSKYAGMALPLRNFSKVWNTTMSGYTDSVKSAMARKWGVRGMKYVDNLMKDLAGGRKQPGDVFGKIKGNFAGSALFANLNVFLQQASSYVTAGSEIGWTPLAKALGSGGKNGRIISRADTELIAKYTPLLWYRSQGMINTDMAEAVRKQPMESKAPWLFGWIEKSDAAVSGRLWYAAQYYVKDNHPELTDGTEEFYRETAKVYNRIMENTQANYTTMQLQDILRNPNKLVRSLTMFMTQTLQNFGIIYDSYGEYSAMRLKAMKEDTEQNRTYRHEAKIKLTRAVSTQVVGAITVAVMQFVSRALLSRVNPYRDDDDNEVSAEGVARGIAMDTVGSVFGSVLGGREVWSALTQLMDGQLPYAVEVPGISQVNEFVQNASALYIAIDGQKGDTQIKKAATNAVMSGCTLLGFPASNLRNIANGLAAAFEDAKNGKLGTWEASKTYVTQNLANAVQTGDAKEIDRIKAKLVSTSKAADPTKSVEEGARKLLKDEYLRLYDEGAEKAKPLGDTIIAKLGGTEKTLQGWVKDAHLDALKTAVESGDLNAAGNALEKRRADGSKDKDTYTSLKSTFLPKMKDALAAGETDVLSGYMRMLEGLYLENAKGENYFDQDKIEAMLFEEETDEDSE